MMAMATGEVEAATLDTIDRSMQCIATKTRPRAAAT